MLNLLNNNNNAPDLSCSFILQYTIQSHEACFLTVVSTVVVSHKAFFLTVVSTTVV